MLKRLTLCSAVTFLVGALCGPGLAAADTQTEINDKVTRSLVFIQMNYSGHVFIPASVNAANRDGRSDEVTVSVTCTGFVVDNNGAIATAGHCVDSGGDDVKEALREEFISEQVKKGNIASTSAQRFLDQANSERWAVDGDDPGSPIAREVQVIQPPGEHQKISSFTTAQVVDFQKVGDGDNALLRLNNFKNLPPLPVAKSAPKSGELLTAAGFPGNVRQVADPSRLPAPSFKSGAASSQQIAEGGQPRTEVNIALSGGMSGGPAVDNDTGEVVGINSSGFTTGTTSFITDAATLRGFLQRNGVQLISAPSEGGKSNTVLFIALGAGVAVAVLLIILAIVLLRRRSSRNAVPAGGWGQGGPGGPTFGGPSAIGTGGPTSYGQNPSQAPSFPGPGGFTGSPSPAPVRPSPPPAPPAPQYRPTQYPPAGPQYPGSPSPGNPYPGGGYPGGQNPGGQSPGAGPYPGGPAPGGGYPPR
ncbi:serine protease [Williamsia sp. CHRR-6]|uniref:S1 family peptidase n=1 Tax=Williamsia sp. CHRR-6 TaxID=2835871 RepID=UPI001BD990B9|nr:serine protease [Williamsia sp. CHRR-6]MBT0568263.1 trypsin-like peptidase domain-containing protein [Williamsia sp. CHRR-6]